MRFYEVSLLPSTKLVNVQYSAIGPSHVGEVADASIVLRGAMLTTELEHDGIVFQGDAVDTISYNLTPNAPKGYDYLYPMLSEFIPDFGLSLGERLVILKEVFVILFLWNNLKEHRHFGVILRRVSVTEHERIGIADFDSSNDSHLYIQRHTGSSMKQPRLATGAEMISSLPVEEFKII